MDRKYAEVKEREVKMPEIVKDYEIKFFPSEPLVEKKKFYCGDKAELPLNYERFGSRKECLQKGYGAALYNAPMESIKEARAKPPRHLEPSSEKNYISALKKKKVRSRPLSRGEIIAIAIRLGIPVELDDKTERESKNILLDIQRRIELLRRI